MRSDSARGSTAGGRAGDLAVLLGRRTWSEVTSPRLTRPEPRPPRPGSTAEARSGRSAKPRRSADLSWSPGEEIGRGYGQRVHVLGLLGIAIRRAHWPRRPEPSCKSVQIDCVHGVELEVTIHDPRQDRILPQTGDIAKEVPLRAIVFKADGMTHVQVADSADWQITCCQGNGPSQTATGFPPPRQFLADRPIPRSDTHW